MPASPKTNYRRSVPLGAVLCLCGLATSIGAAAETNTVGVAAPNLPDATLSLFRVAGALAVVIALFLGGVWLFRNWQRLVVRRGRAPKLNVLEVRSLGGRHAIYVVGYEQERFLLSSSPAGMNLLSHLPPAEPSSREAAETPAQTEPSARISFPQVLAQVLKGR